MENKKVDPDNKYVAPANSPRTEKKKDQEAHCDGLF